MNIICKLKLDASGRFSMLHLKPVQIINLQFRFYTVDLSLGPALQ